MSTVSTTATSDVCGRRPGRTLSCVVEAVADLKCAAYNVGGIAGDEFGVPRGLRRFWNGTTDAREATIAAGLTRPPSRLY